MANEGFSEEERSEAYRKVTTYWFEWDAAAIDLQCSLTRAQNELAEANRKLAEREWQCKCGGVGVSNASGDITRTCIRCGSIVRKGAK